MNNTLPELRIYISFIADDLKFAQPCAKLIQNAIKVTLNTDYHTTFYSPENIPVGENTSDTLEEHINESDIAIILVSHSYLIEKNEALRVYTKHPHPIIIQLEPINHGASFTPFDRSDVVVEHSFIQAQDSGRTTEIEFSNQVATIIQRTLTERESHHPSPLPTLSPQEIAEQLIAIPLSEFTVKTIPSRATRGFGAAVNAENSNNNDVSAPVTDIVEELVRWSHTPSSDQPRLCALLGDVGTGKTTTSILVAHRLLELRKKGDPVPFPFYFDLRKISPNGLDDFGLHVLLTKFLAGYTHQFTSANEILDIIHNENTLLIFDGLDELLVHLSLSDGQRLTRSLLDALNLSDSNSGDKTPQTRLLLSCRTQYFRTLEDEVCFFDHDEARHKGDNITLVLTLLPFDEDQIQEYLRRNVPNSDPNRILDMIRSVHDLGALASQPVLLNMIRDILPAVEEDSRGNHRVRSVDIYKRFVDGWLRRDIRKHSFTPEHKIQLMTHLAWQVWRSGARTWNAEQMDDWLLEFCDKHKNIQRRSRDHTSDQLTQDFRTATFLTRRGDNLTFVHTSFLEYFLAVRLHDSLFNQAEEDMLSTWDITRPSNETFTFFAELIDSLAGDVQSHTIARLEYIGKHASVTARENIFAYTLRTLEEGTPRTRPNALVLSDTDLRGWRIGSMQTHLNLSGVPLRSARLDDAHIINTNLDGADATASSMRRTLFEHCTLTNATFSDADLAGTVFRHCNMEGAFLDKAKRYRTQLLHTTGNKSDLTHVLSAPSKRYKQLSIMQEIQNYGGHNHQVITVAYAPDGNTLATGSVDGTVRIWDCRSGECIFTFNHNGCVNSVAWSPDGNHILTGSNDNKAHIWDTNTGKEVLSLPHNSSVHAVAWSPDGKQAITGSRINAYIWNTATGAQLHTLPHSDWVQAVAWSPDNRLILTGSRDRLVRIWDLESDQEPRMLEHKNWVTAVAWSPDGTQFLTASHDKTACIWDASTMQKQHSLQHRNWVSDAAWSPSGTCIITGSHDRTAQIWDAENGYSIRTLAHDRPVKAVAWSSGEDNFATSSGDHTTRIWNYSKDNHHITLGSINFTQAIAWAPDARYFLSKSDHRTVQVWDVKSRNNSLTLHHGEPISEACWSPKGNHILTISLNYLRIWNTSEPTYIEIIPDGRIGLAIWSPTGEHVLTFSNQTIHIWNANRGTVSSTLPYTNYGNALAWSPNSEHIIFSTSRKGKVKVWEPRTNMTYALKQTKSVTTAVWSPDSTHFVTVPHKGKAQVWKTGDYTPICSLTKGVITAAWSPDSTRILTVSRDGNTRIWTFDARYKTLAINQRQRVSKASWSPDGHEILISSMDGTTSIWDAKTGEPVHFMIATLPEGEFAVLSADRTEVIGASPYAWRWLGRYVKHPDGSIERVPVEIDGPLPPLSHGGETASGIEG